MEKEFDKIYFWEVVCTCGLKSFTPNFASSQYTEKKAFSRRKIPPKFTIVLSICNIWIFRFYSILIHKTKQKNGKYLPKNMILESKRNFWEKVLKVLKKFHEGELKHKTSILPLYSKPILLFARKKFFSRKLIVFFSWKWNTYFHNPSKITRKMLF